MGNDNDHQSFVKKGEGLRILSVKPNSPFDSKVQPFFDFIVDVIPLEKPSQSEEKKLRRKHFTQIMAHNQQKNVEIKVVSTKHRNVRSMVITSNRNWNSQNDFTGLTLRKQNFNEVFDTYFPIGGIALNSPARLAGLKQGQYLIGCLQFSYATLDKFIEGLFDRFFDKQVSDKHVNLALYEIATDQLRIKSVLLKRGWGGQGLLGCQFLQGQIYKFPANLKERRNQYLKQEEVKKERQQLKKDLRDCNGVSKALIQNLKSKRNKRGMHLQTIKNMISIPVPQIPQPVQMSLQDENRRQAENTRIYEQKIRVDILEKRLACLEDSLESLTKSIGILASQQESEQQKQMIKNAAQNQKQNISKVQCLEESNFEKKC